MTDGQAEVAHPIEPVVADSTAEAASPNPSPKTEFFKLRERLDATGAEKDIGLLACALIAKKGNQILKEKQNLDPQNLKKSVDKPEGDILTFAYLLRPDFKGVRMSEGLKVVTTADGSYDIPKPGVAEGNSIVQIFKREGNSFVCDLGDGKPVLIPVETVLSAHVVAVFSSPEKIQRLIEAKLFTQEETSVISAYVDSITGNRPEPSKEISKDVVEKLAASSGLVTAEALRSFATSNLKKVEPELTPTPGTEDVKTAPEKNPDRDFNKRVDEIIKTLVDRSIASPEDFSHVFQLVAPESIESTKTRISKLKTEASEKLEKVKETSPEEQKKIEDEILKLTQLEAFFDGMNKVVAEQDLTTEFFSRIQIGEIDPETTTSLDGALRENDSQKIINILLNSEKIDEATKKKVKKFPKGVLVGGGISLALLFFLIWKSMKGEKDGMSQMGG